MCVSQVLHTCCMTCMTGYFSCAIMGCSVCYNNTGLHAAYVRMRQSDAELTPPHASYLLRCCNAQNRYVALGVGYRKLDAQ